MGGRKRGSAIKKRQRGGSSPRPALGSPCPPPPLSRGLAAEAPAAAPSAGRGRPAPATAAAKSSPLSASAAAGSGGAHPTVPPPPSPPRRRGPSRAKRERRPPGRPPRFPQPWGARPAPLRHAPHRWATRDPPLRSSFPPFPPTAVRRLGPAEGGGVAVGPGAAPPGSEGTPGANRAHRRPHDVRGLFCVPSLLGDGRWEGWVAAARCDLIWESPAAMET